MLIKITMPKLGETMEEGEIVLWLKKEGDRIKEGEPLLEIATDKANMEVEALASGFLRKIIVSQGEVVPVGGIIAYITDKMEEEIPEEKREVIQPSIIGDRSVKVSPLAKKLAKEHKINLSQVKGTGPGGRIVKEDILKLIKEEAPRGEEIFLTGAEKLTAKRMVQSKREAPHFYLTMEVDFSRAVRMCQELREEIEEKRGVHLTYTDLLIKACARALRKFPRANSTFKDGKINLYPQVNIGLAVAREKGLIVPVIKNVDRKNLFQIAEERNDLVEKAKEDRLSLEELEKGTFTLTNLGMFGVKGFTAIINPPQACILATGEIREKPVAVEERLEIRPIMEMTLSGDHRVMDGVLGAKFLQEIKRGLEKPSLLLVEEVKGCSPG